jgi:hypothetical protein
MKIVKPTFNGYTDWNVRRWILAPPIGPSTVGIATVSLEAFDALSGKRP